MRPPGRRHAQVVQRIVALARALLFVLGLLAAPLLVAAQHEEHTGSGDDVVRISKPEAGFPALLVIRGNGGSNYFGVTGFTVGRERTGSLVNTTQPYSGIVATDLPALTTTALLEISATGPWTIEVYSIGAAQKIDAPGSRQGEGDNVLWVVGEAVTATIRGNLESRYFGVTAYDSSGNRLGSLVNTTDPYNGKVLLPRGLLLLEIHAEGAWGIGLDSEIEAEPRPDPTPRSNEFDEARRRSLQRRLDSLAARNDSIVRAEVFDPTLDPPVPEWATVVGNLDTGRYFVVNSNCWRDFIQEGALAFYQTEADARAARLQRSSFCNDG